MMETFLDRRTAPTPPLLLLALFVLLSASVFDYVHDGRHLLTIPCR
jgi:hypothetical protein